MILAVTGAAGRIGQAVRPALLKAGHTLRSGDLQPGIVSHAAETWLEGDLRNRAHVDELLAGADAVVHLAGTGNEQPLPAILANNHEAVFEVFEGARRHGVRRVIYASSNHAFGLHPVNRRLRLNDAYRPDCFHGLSKVWGESLGRMYWEKHGIECVALRIGTFKGVAPRNRHELATWIGAEDLARLVVRAVEAEAVAFSPVWGISANTRAWYDLTEPNAIGYVPRQNAEDFAASALAGSTESDPVASRYQGGSVVTLHYTPDEDRP